MKKEVHIKTLRFRIKDRHAGVLRDMATSVNQVWNYCNELSYRSIRERRKFLSGYDLQHYTKGASKELGINSATIQMVGHQYVDSRKLHKKIKLRWRSSFGKKRALGWVPFRHDCIKFEDGYVIHHRHRFKIWDSYGLAKYKLGSGDFSEDARGRWYFNVTVECESNPTQATSAIGIDLGCKEAASASNGEVVSSREYRKLEQKLGIAQRANKAARVRNIHAKIKNRRKDKIHKFTSKLVSSSSAVLVGNVSSLGLIKTKKAKSVLDAGWGIIKEQLHYKCNRAGVVFEVVNEAYSTQTCSCCQKIPGSSPKGSAGLGIREWVCSECGAEHDRDINAAKNILAAGLRRLEAGIPL